MVLVYIFRQAAFGLLSFFEHWYVRGFRVWWNFVAHSISQFDRSYGWRVTGAHLFEPLYKDFSAVGYLLGVPFRIGRFFAGLLFYVLFLFVSATIFLVWLCVPAYLIMRIIFG